MNAEEGASIRAVRRVYAEKAGLPFDEAPEPKEIYAIGKGEESGDQAAAVEAFRQLGEVVGDAMGTVLTLVDGLGVIGGGLSGAASLFLPALIDELNSHYVGPDGQPFRRLVPQAHNLEDAADLARFLHGERRTITIPGSEKQVVYDPLARLGVGLSVLGTNQAVAVGAYAFALRALDQSKNPSV
jgi:glucokinase